MNDPKTYVPMPDHRPHPCHQVNAAGVPVAWLVHEDAHGVELETTDAYGDGSLTNVTFCPWCGERVHGWSDDEKLTPAGRKRRNGIVRS